LNGCWVVVATFSAFVLLALRRALSFDLHVGGRFRSTCFEVVCFRSTCFEVGLSALSVEWLQQPAKLNWGFCEAVPPYPPVSMLTGIVPERVSKKNQDPINIETGGYGGQHNNKRRSSETSVKFRRVMIENSTELICSAKLSPVLHIFWKEPSKVRR